MFYRRTKIFPSPTAKNGPTNNAAGTIKRRVRIDESRNKVYDNTEWTKKDCKRLWYPKGAIREMKAQVHAETKNKTKVFQKVLQAVYDECCQADSDTAVLSDFGEYSLHLCVAQNLDRHRPSRKMDHDKRRRKKELQTAVRMQYDQTGGGSVQARAELIRLASEPLTRPGRLLARFTAVALAESLAA